jgi:hypothetical protein
MRSWPIAAKSFLVIGLALLLYLTNQLFLMVAGSDSTSFLISPARSIQLVCLILFAIMLLVPARPIERTLLAIAALCAALVASHRLVIDNLRHEIRDVYLGVPVQSLALDPADEGGLVLRPTPAGFRIGWIGNHPTLWCFSPAVIGLDQTELSRVVNKI